MGRRSDIARGAAWRSGWRRWLLCLLVGLAGTALVVPTDLAIAKPRRRHGVAPQIINGQPVEPGQDRFVVALLDATRGTSQFDRQFCGGSIIGRRYVLTAAHCMEDEQAANLSVLIDQVALDAGGGIEIAVKRVAVDPLFADAHFRNDAAVLTLAKKIPRRRGQRIALVGPGDETLAQAGDTVAVAGWGNTSASGNAFPTNLMQTDVAIVADADCAQAYGGQFDPATMVCAAGEAPSRDSCQGDSGGPLFADENADRPVQVGIVSWGNGCAQAGFPGVYTRLSDLGVAGWIHAATARRRSKR